MKKNYLNPNPVYFSQELIGQISKQSKTLKNPQNHSTFYELSQQKILSIRILSEIMLK